MPNSSPRERGSVAVEFSLVLLPLFALLLMTMDLAWILFGWACIQEGVREGVRYAVTGSGQSETTLDSSIRNVVKQYSFGFVNSSNVSSVVTVDYYSAASFSSSTTPTPVNGLTGATGKGNVVKVTVSGVAVGTFGPIFRNWTPMTLAASSSDVMQ
jgi:Flp pilus assembly protein TadG